ncbi:hypothetical protein BH18GEM1_BH18GEM1_14440 [soil metagenome]
MLLVAVLAVAAFAVVVGGSLWPRPQFSRGPWVDPSTADSALAETIGTIPADQWLNAPAGGLSGTDLRGNVVLVEFWTYLCYNCKNVEPWMKETHAALAPEGLVVIGVHTPEFDGEREVGNVRAYLRENGIGWPVAIDNGHEVWRKYNATHAWPAFLVYDRAGRLVYRRAGERAVEGARTAIEKALAEPAPATGLSGGNGAVTAVTALRTSPRSAALEVACGPCPVSPS